MVSARMTYEELRRENARLRQMVDAITGPPMTPEEAEAEAEFANIDTSILTDADREAMAGIDIGRIIAYATDPANMTTTEAIKRLVEEAKKHPAFDQKVIREAMACFDRQFE